MPSTAQVYLKKSRARHVREHGEHLLSPYDPTDPAGAAVEAVVELPFNLVQVLTALRLLLLAENAREALAAAVRKAERRRQRVGGRSGSRWGRRQPEARRINTIDLAQLSLREGFFNREANYKRSSQPTTHA